MGREQEIKEIEAEIWSIFRKDFIPTFLVNKANTLIHRWKILTGWKTDTTPVLKDDVFLFKDEVYIKVK
jgi:hypothetical protein